MLTVLLKKQTEAAALIKESEWEREGESSAVTVHSVRTHTDEPHVNRCRCTWWNLSDGEKHHEGTEERMLRSADLFLLQNKDQVAAMRGEGRKTWVEDFCIFYGPAWLHTSRVQVNTCWPQPGKIVRNRGWYFLLNWHQESIWRQQHKRILVRAAFAASAEMRKQMSLWTKGGDGGNGEGRGLIAAASRTNFPQSSGAVTNNSQDPNLTEGTFGTMRAV